MSRRNSNQLLLTCGGDATGAIDEYGSNKYEKYGDGDGRTGDDEQRRCNFNYKQRQQYKYQPNTDYVLVSKE